VPSLFLAPPHLRDDERKLLILFGVPDGI
jgi:hypothetical protein